MILRGGQLFELIKKQEEHKKRHGSYPLSLKGIRLGTPKKRKKSSTREIDK